MSKEDKNIDNLFKEKLDGRAFDGPPADFLADLNQRLNAKPVVSVSWIWLLFLNFFIIGLFIANTIIDSSTPKTAEARTQVENDESRIAKEKFNKTENEQQKIISAKTSETQSDQSTTKESLNNTAEVKSKALATDELDPSSNEANQVKKNKSENNSTDSRTQREQSIKNKSTKTSENNSTDSNTNKSSLSKDASNPSDNSKKKITSQGSKETNTSVANNSQSERKDKSVNGDTETEANNRIKGEKTASNKERVTLTGTESLSSYVSYSAIYAPQFEEVDRKITNNDFPEFPSRWNELVAEDKNEPSEEIRQKETDTNKSRFEIQLHGGATQWNFKTLGTNDDYVTKIDEAATPKWTPNFGLGFNVNFNNISVGTGLNYAKFKTENLFEFTEVNTYDSTYIAGYDATVVNDSSGNPVDTIYTPYYDSTTVSDTSYNITQVTNQYEWIQIPIHFGYRFNLNKWAIIPRVGMNIGLGIRQSSGQYPNEAYDNLQTVDPVKWHLNLHTSLEVRRGFGNWHAFGQFNYQRNLTPTIDNALFERKYNGIGFSAGVGYSF